jgi:cell division septation protein DedD
MKRVFEGHMKAERIEAGDGEDGLIQWHFVHPRRRRRPLHIAAVAAAVMGAGYAAVEWNTPAISVVARPQARRDVSVTAAAPRPAAPVSPTRGTVPLSPEGSGDSATHAVVIIDTSAAVVAAANPATTYAVQVAAVPEAREAQELLDRLAKDGYPAYLERTTTGQRRLHRVRVGPLPSRSAAQDVSSRLVEAGFVAPWIAGPDQR